MGISYNPRVPTPNQIKSNETNCSFFSYYDRETKSVQRIGFSKIDLGESQGLLVDTIAIELKKSNISGIGQCRRNGLCFREKIPSWNFTPTAKINCGIVEVKDKRYQHQYLLSFFLSRMVSVIITSSIPILGTHRVISPA